MADKNIKKELAQVEANNASALDLIGLADGSADNFEAIKMIGRMESMQFFATVAEKAQAELFLSFKESKKYKGLTYLDGNGNTRRVADLDEFCQVFLKKSARRVQELVSNYNLLGADLYEQSEKLGFRQRDYNALKALPADDRILIAEAIESENLEKALDLMQSLATKHAFEREKLTKTIEDQQSTLIAREEIIKDKQSRLDEKTEEVIKLENKARLATVDEQANKLRDKIQHEAALVKATVMTSMTAAMGELFNLPGDHRDFCAACLLEVSREVSILRGLFQLPSQLTEDTMPEWLSKEQLAEINAMGGE